MSPKAEGPTEGARVLSLPNLVIRFHSVATSQQANPGGSQVVVNLSSKPSPKVFAWTNFQRSRSAVSWPSLAEFILPFFQSSLISPLVSRRPRRRGNRTEADWMAPYDICEWAINGTNEVSTEHPAAAPIAMNSVELVHSQRRFNESLLDRLNLEESC